MVVLMLLQPPVSHGFVPSSSSSSSSSTAIIRKEHTTLCRAATVNGDSSSNNEERKQEPTPTNTNVKRPVPKKPRIRTLYDVLGASPTASTEQLRRKYTDLARQTHPDAVLHRSRSGSVDDINLNETSLEDDVVVPDIPDFSEIAAAWRVLSDPRERRRYDRELKAKELADNLEDWMDVGIRNAIPFIRKTADTTMVVMESSSRNINKTATELSSVAKDVSERMERARKRLDLDTRRRELEQQ
jgi:hypothetical protein